MLEVLHIENIAIIEEADIRFEAGFNALTGETGAGKSIVIDALSAVLGQRTSRELIRTGADKAFVSAVFSGVDSAIAEEQGVTPEEDGSLLLQREIHSDGKSVCRVGGRPVTVGQLKALGSRLLNIHGQHDGQQLLDEEQHLQFLDSFGKLESLINTYAEKYNSFTAIQRKIQSLQMDESEKARRVDTLTYQINELERAKLRAGEEEELAARRNLLRNAEKFTSAVAEADYALNGDDSGDGALGMLRRAQDSVGAVRHLDEEFACMYDHSPIHHIEYRIKSLDSILDMLKRRGYEITIDNIYAHIQDLAGIRVICNYLDDIYYLRSLLTRFDAFKVIREVDYIKNPTPSGYRSLHLVVNLPIVNSEGTKVLPVELQLRTIAMDMWASLEHELRYKSDRQFTDEDATRLRLCSDAISEIDQEMQDIYQDKQPRYHA